MRETLFCSTVYANSLVQKVSKLIKVDVFLKIVKKDLFFSRENVFKFVKGQTNCIIVEHVFVSKIFTE